MLNQSVAITGNTPMERWKNVANTGQYPKVAEKVAEAEFSKLVFLFGAVLAIALLAVAVGVHVQTEGQSFPDMALSPADGIALAGGVIFVLGVIGTYFTYYCESRPAREEINRDTQNITLRRLMAEQESARAREMHVIEREVR